MNQPNQSKEIDKLLKLYLLSGQKRTENSGFNQGDQNKMNPISQLTQLAPLLPALSNLFQLSSMNQNTQNQNTNQNTNTNNNLNLGNTNQNLNQIASLIPNLSTLISSSLGIFSNQQNFNQNQNQTQNNTNNNINNNNFDLNNNFNLNNNLNEQEQEKEKETEKKLEKEKPKQNQTQRKRIQTRKEKQESNNEFIKANNKKRTVKKRRIIGTKKVRRGGRQPIPRENLDPKAVERMESNRLAAREFRKREKKKIDQLQERVSKLEQVNQRYRLSVSTLIENRNRMVNELEQIQRGILTSISISNPISNSAIFASKERNPKNQSGFNGPNNGGGGGFY
ncbi:chascon [Anaeramoeba flamelloides]|uniref:Chascon n=2 Tax=Anaeramoeba flamelloides TaxID=1746091 RepID=A0ABQ8Y9G2_9EUKA|nr:chascon [Anaeramoeba flamelloides]